MNIYVNSLASVTRALSALAITGPTEGIAAVAFYLTRLPSGSPGGREEKC
jgi:hypothetical protein